MEPTHAPIPETTETTTEFEQTAAPETAPVTEPPTEEPTTTTSATKATAAAVASPPDEQKDNDTNEQTYEGTNEQIGEITVGHKETVTLILLLVIGCPLFYLMASYCLHKNTKKGTKKSFSDVAYSKLIPKS